MTRYVSKKTSAASNLAPQPAGLQRSDIGAPAVARDETAEAPMLSASFVYIVNLRWCFVWFGIALPGVSASSSTAMSHYAFSSCQTASAGDQWWICVDRKPLTCCAS
jgi:hypothetical protein